MEAAIGIVIGAFLSWIISHYYYRRQTKEQINPIPHIQELKGAVQELVNLAEGRNDKELESKIKQLVIAVTQSQFRVLNAITAPLGLITMLLDEHKNGDLDQFVDKTSNLFERSKLRLLSIRAEFEELKSFANKQVGKDLIKSLTKEEHDELLRGLYKPIE